MASPQAAGKASTATARLARARAQRGARWPIVAQPCPRQQRRPPRQRQQGCGPSQQRADAVHPQPGRQQCQRPVDLGVAAGGPGEAGEDHTACQFGHQPGSGKAAGVGQRPAAAPVRHPGHGRSQVQRQRGRQQRHRRHGQRRRQAAIAVQADEQPPGGGHQPGGAEGPAQHGSTARRGAGHAPGQQGDRRQRQRPGGGVHTGQGLQGAGGGHCRQFSPGPARMLRRRASSIRACCLAAAGGPPGTSAPPRPG